MRLSPSILAVFVIIGFFIGTFLTGVTDLMTGILLTTLIIGLPAAYFGIVYAYPMQLTQKGKIREAETLYSRILEWRIPVNRTQLYIRRAALRNALGDAEGAIADYTSAMHHSTHDNASLYGMRSALYLSQREFAKALEDTDKLLKLRPNSEIGFANRAAARMFLGDAQGALADVDQGLEHSRSASGKALLYNNRGTAHRLMGDFASAISDYNLALSVALQPRERQMVHPSIITNQGIIYYLQEEYDQAKAYFHQAQNMMPNFLRALAGLAIARFKLGQVDEAQKLWNELVSKEPRYRDLTWLSRELNWPAPMMHDAGELMERISA